MFADVDVYKDGSYLGRTEPAKFVYKKQDMTTTEVAILHRLGDDVYVIVGSINPQTKVAAFQIHINRHWSAGSGLNYPVVLIAGSAGLSHVAAGGVGRVARMGGAHAVPRLWRLCVFSRNHVGGNTVAQAQSMSHEGTVHIENEARSQVDLQQTQYDACWRLQSATCSRPALAKRLPSRLASESAPR